MEVASNQIIALYYDENIAYEEIEAIYQVLKPQFPKLVVLPNHTKIQTLNLKELKALKASIENIIQILED